MEDQSVEVLQEPGLHLPATSRVPLFYIPEVLDINECDLIYFHCYDEKEE